MSNTDPFKITGPAVVSFSGGRTSGYMLHRILEAHGGTLPEDVRVVFCNTGKERPETLDFVERCSLEWGVCVTWLEYRYETPFPCPTCDADWASLDDSIGGERDRRWDMWHAMMAPLKRKHAEEVQTESARRKILKKNDRKNLPRLRKGVGAHRVVTVDYATASRCGEPLEEVIVARNMLPNIVSRFCTVETKICSTQRFLRLLGWALWKNAIGFRADEPQRVYKLRTTNRHNNEDPVTPLASAGVVKDEILSWWKRQPFDLQLEQHEGNCDLCFLKGGGQNPDHLAGASRPGRMVDQDGGRGGPPRPHRCILPQGPTTLFRFGGTESQPAIARHGRRTRRTEYRVSLH